MDAVFGSPLSRVGIATARAGVSQLNLCPPVSIRFSRPNPRGADCGSLARVFDDSTVPRNIRLYLHGTQFQRRVWRAVQSIRSAVGSVCAYGELGRRLGTSALAVGNACRSNSVPIVAPCHRVVAARGY